MSSKILFIILFSLNVYAGNVGLVFPSLMKGLDYMNPSDKSASTTLSQNNLKSVTSNTGGMARAIYGISSGKWYYEVTTLAASGMVGYSLFGAGTAAGVYPGSVPGSGGYWQATGNKYVDGAGGAAYGATYTTNDVIGVAVDMTTQGSGTITMYKNGASQGVIQSGLTGTIFPTTGGGAGTGGTYTLNFGHKTFTGTIPSGYNAGLWLTNQRVWANWSQSDKSANITLSSNNLVATQGATFPGAVRSTIGKSSGKWYWEITTNSQSGGSRGVGNASAVLTNYPGFDANGIEYDKDGKTYTSNAGTAYGPTFTTEVIGIALDVDSRTVTFYVNGVIANATPKSLPTNLQTGTIYAMVGSGYNAFTHIYTANFGATAFSYSVPTGYNAGLYQ